MTTSKTIDLSILDQQNREIPLLTADIISSPFFSKRAFPELTYRQYRVVIAHALSIPFSILATHDNVTTCSCNKLLKRASEKLHIKEKDIRSLVLLRCYFGGGLL
jgi:hypothetical protein